MTRSSARELLMQLIFQMEVQQDFSDELKNRYLSDVNGIENQLGYINGMFANIKENLEEIDATISQYSDKWKINRLPKVDLSILRVAVAEIRSAEDIPREVSINEAVELAKKFSTEDGSKFINGILSKVE